MACGGGTCARRCSWDLCVDVGEGYTEEAWAHTRVLQVHQRRALGMFSTGSGGLGMHRTY